MYTDKQIRQFAAICEAAANACRRALDEPNTNARTVMEMMLGLVGEEAAESGGLRHLLRHTAQHHDWTTDLDPLRYVRPDLADMVKGQNA